MTEVIQNNQRKFPRIRVEKRVEVTRFHQALALLLALVFAIGITALLVWLAGVSPREALLSLFLGSVGSKRALLDSFISATPLILTGISVVIAYRGGVFSIGAEGQFFMGAIVAYWAYWTFSDLPRVPLIIIVLIASMVGGALLSGLAAVLKRWFEVDVVISTVLLNYIVFLLISYLLSVGMPWNDPDSFTVASRLINDSAKLPIIIEGSRLHMGLIIALLASILIYIILEKTPLGYEIRAVGINDIAAMFRGISSSKILIATMLISGAIAGLAGSSELFGLGHRLKPALSNGFGYTGILVAVLAGLNPLAVVPAAFLFGALSNGAFKMQVNTGVETSLIFGIQAMILILLLISQVIVTYKIGINQDDN